MTEEATAPAPVVNMTIDEFAETLNGYEELAISEHFKIVSLTELLEKNATMAIRALMFTHVHRENGNNVAKAKHDAMTATLKEAMGYFAAQEGDGDLDPDDPDTSEGKDDSQPA